MLALLAAPAAWADNTADEADVAFALGNDAYAKREYRKALAAYFLSYRLVPNRNVLFNLARCYEALGEVDEAYRYWFDLSVDEGLPERDRPEVDAQLRRLAPRVALLRVESEPPGADVYLDREDLGSKGQTPRTLAVPAGPHELKLKKDGFHVGAVKVKAVVGREVKRVVTLEAVVGTVKLTGTPKGASVKDSSDGRVLGKLPGYFELTPGQHILVVEESGYLPSQVLVDVKGDAETQYSVKLVERPKPTGKVIVTANQEDALVLVDGKESGFTPTVLNLSLGEHVLEVTGPELEPYRKKLTITEDSETKLNVELRYAQPKVEAASKSAVSVDQAPASVTVLSRDEILAFGWQTLPEALLGVRGFFFTDDRSYTYAGVRGFSPPGDFNTRILVLWDGHSINDIYVSQGYIGRDFDVDLSEVERIEVVRGPVSVLFGTGAFFGLINVVPRQRVSGRYAEVVAGGGGQGGMKARATGRLANDTASVMLSAAGFLSAGAPYTEVGDTTVKGNDGERAIGATLKARWKGLSVRAKWNQRRKNFPTAIAPAQLNVPGTEYTDARGFAELRFEHEWETVGLFARASYDGLRFRGTYAKLDDDGARFRSSDFASADWASAEVRVGVTLMEGNRLTASLEGQAQFVGQQSSGGAPLTVRRFFIAATLMDEWQVLPWLSLQAGLRLDKYNDVAEFAFSPRLAAVLKPYAQGTTKVMFGRGFRAPNVYELFFEDNRETQRAALSLKPEFITSIELEHSHDFLPELRLSGGVFFNIVDSQLGLQQEELDEPLCGTPGNPVQCLITRNLGQTLHAVGAEADLRWQPGRFFLLDAAYSFVFLTGPLSGSQEQRAEQAESIRHASAYPMHMASLRGMVPLKDKLLRASAQAMYQSRRLDTAAKDGDGNSIDVYAGEALFINAGIAGEIGAFRYFAGIRNLLDSQHEVPIGDISATTRVKEYGRTFWFELSGSL